MIAAEIESLGHIPILTDWEISLLFSVTSLEKECSKEESNLHRIAPTRT